MSALFACVVALACSGRSVVGPSDEPDIGRAGGGTTGGAGGAGGSGDGVGGTILSPGGNGNGPCDGPPVAVTLKHWVEPEPQASPAAANARVVEGMIGDWYGVVTTPWTPPYVVTLRFTKEETYSARCVWSSNGCCLAFYYGTDDDSDLKRYAIEGVTLDGEGYGSIDVVFGEAGTYYESGYQGALESVELDATLERLRFTFMYGAHGPLSFDLARQGEAPPK